MEKLKKTARVLDKIIKVLRGICFGCAIACAILLIIAIVLPDSMYSGFVNLSDMSINLGTVQLQLTRSIEPQGSVRLLTCAVLAYTVVILAISAYGLHLLRNILKPMGDGRPFDSIVSGNLCRLAWLTLAGVVVSDILRTAAAFLEIRMYDFSKLFAEGLVKRYTVQNTIDFTYLLIPALLFLLSYVFRYGEELQKQSDETL